MRKIAGIMLMIGILCLGCGIGFYAVALAIAGIGFVLLGWLIALLTEPGAVQHSNRLNQRQMEYERQFGLEEERESK